ncbi:MAG: lysophospholipid acyltransferase family protein, partial [Longimicrobiales bacterium]
MKIRGILTIAVAGTALVVGDVVQRTLLVAALRLFPSRRHRILTSWQQALARLMLWSARVVGGASHGEIPRIPGGPGTLVLMNHQSLMDIPLVVRTLQDTYPRIVTRARYARGKPLISHMVRLYQYPTVDPGATVRAGLEDLREQTASSPVPVVIFPEGTRTRDGNLSKFRRMGLRAILGGRSWQVWIVAVDGWWEAARLDDFLTNISSVEGRMSVAGPFTSPEPGESVGAFIADMEQRMSALLG